MSTYVQGALVFVAAMGIGLAVGVTVVVCRIRPPGVSAWKAVRHYWHTAVLLGAVIVCERVPRRFLPERFVLWHNEALDNWTWNP